MAFPKLLVALLIGVAAFVALLAGMMATGVGIPDAPDPSGSPGATSTARPSATHKPPTTTATAPPTAEGASVSVLDASAEWADRETLQLTLRVRNGGDEAATATRVQWRLDGQGETLDSGDAPTDTAVPPGEHLLQLQVPFTAGTGAQWWAAQADDAEAASLRLTGTLRFGAQQVPFEWERAWQGGLSQALSNLSDCAPGSAGLCVASSRAYWSGGGLELRLTFENRGAESVRTGGDVALAFGGAPVASGALGRERIGPGERATVEATLRFALGDLEAWWTEHVGACESSAASLAFGSGDALEVGPYRTFVACGDAAGGAP